MESEAKTMTKNVLRRSASKKYEKDVLLLPPRREGALPPPGISMRIRCHRLILLTGVFVLTISTLFSLIHYLSALSRRSLDVILGNFVASPRVSYLETTATTHNINGRIYPLESVSRRRPVEVFLDDVDLEPFPLQISFLPTPQYPLTRHLSPDYGGLVLEPRFMVDEDLFSRRIRPDDALVAAADRKHFLKSIEDDKESEFYYPYDEREWHQQSCRRPAWSYVLHPVCNNLHEHIHYDRPVESGRERSDQRFEMTYLGHGYYRDAFVFADETESVVVKSLCYERPAVTRNFGKVYAEAVALERLTVSDKIANIYGHCGSTVMVEKGERITERVIPTTRWTRPRYMEGHMAQEDLDKLQQHDVHPMNNFTASEKLDMAIAMAESLAEMHGYDEGAFTNDDISLDQWLLSADGRIMLNDCNNVVYLEFDEDRQKYCKYATSFSGTFKAPEELSEKVTGGYVDTSVDVHGMGNVIYALLTGLKPYYFEESRQKIMKMIKNGGRPYIDPRYSTSRSIIEKRMVEIMDACLSYRPEERPEIFEVVRFLRETKELYQ